jgi:hypothetical protein
MGIAGSGTTKKRSMPQKKRFAVGAEVVISNPGVLGVITQADDKPTVLWEYWHRIKTDHREYHEPGCNLELVPMPISNTPPSPRHSIHLHGDHSRINVNSTDNSTNIVSESRVFLEMRETAAAVPDEADRAHIVAAVGELEKAQGSVGFFPAYQTFIEVAANHMTLFAPFLPALAQMLQHIK